MGISTKLSSPRLYLRLVSDTMNLPKKSSSINLAKKHILCIDVHGHFIWETFKKHFRAHSNSSYTCIYFWSGPFVLLLDVKLPGSTFPKSLFLVISNPKLVQFNHHPILDIGCIRICHFSYRMTC